MRGLRIVLVEDDAIICTLLIELLSEMGHEVCATAQTELEAVAAAERSHPDVMIVDAMLRVGGGVAAMGAILRRTEMPHIFMTGGPQTSIPAHATVLYKPFSTPELAAALDSVTWQARLRSAAIRAPLGERSAHSQS